MVVTVVCDVLGDANNGTTIAALNLIGYLRDKGHEVRVVCPDADKADLPGYYVVPRINFHLFNNYVEKNGVALAKPDQEIIRAALDGCDVVHIMMPFFIGAYTAKYAKEHGIPVTAGFHCQAENVTNHFFLMNDDTVNRFTYRLFYRVLYQYCDCIHYPTQFICDTFEAEVGPTPHRIISNGVAAAFVPQNEPKPPQWANKTVILFTGRYSKEKSHRVLIDGASRSRHRDQIQLVFAGDGPQKEALIRQAEKLLPLQPVMQFFSREELIRMINCADLYVHPAEIEIEAISCLEAISCGKVPVISDSPRSATRVFALNPENRFRCNDPDDLAAKIDFWVEHPEEKERCVKQYLGYAKQFQFDHCMEQMEQMLHHAIEHPSADVHYAGEEQEEVPV